MGAKRVLKEKQVWAIRFHLSSRKRVCDRALFNIAIDSKPRDRNVARPRVSDVTSGNHIRTRSTLAQQKTGRPVQYGAGQSSRLVAAARQHLG